MSDAMNVTPLPGKPRRPWWLWLVVAAPLGLCALFVLVGGLTAFKRYVTDGPSMEPALPDGETFFLLRSFWAGDPEPGAMVVARPPDGIDTVKRVIAIGGQTIEMRDDVVYVDGRAIESAEIPCPIGFEASTDDDAVCMRERLGAREWTTMRSRLVPPEHFEPLTVPAGHVFLMGDHRDRANDSRNPLIGALPWSAVVGEVVGRD